MKVLFVCQNPVKSTAGGIQHITYELDRAFHEKGIESVYLSVRKDHKKKLDNNYYIPDNVKIESDINKLYIAELIINKSVDVIINQCGIDFKLSKLLFDSASGKPVITCFHNSLLGGIDNFYHLHQPLFRRFNISRNLIENRYIKSLIRAVYVYTHKKGYKTICRKSAKVVVLTKSMFSELKTFVGGDELKNVLTIPNFVSSIEPAQKKDVRMIVYVGRIDRLYKQTDLAIYIWKKFSEKHPEYQFHLIGDGKDLDYVKQLAVRTNCTNIYFEGQKSPEHFYEKASMLVFTSCCESFGLVLIEAMANGVVPVAFDSYSAIHEIIDDGVNGCLVTPFDTEKFADALGSLVEDKKRLNQMSMNAIAKSRIFSKDKAIEKWIDLIERV